MSTIPNLQPLKQRLGQLSVQAAKYGISADPSITMEVRDLEIVVQQMSLIEIQRGNLDTLLRQRSQFGAHVPAHIVGQIRDIRQEIERLRAVCAKYGHPVPPHPLDSDEPSARTEARTGVPPNTDPLVIVRERLRDIEAMLRNGLTDRALALVKDTLNYLQ